MRKLALVCLLLSSLSGCVYYGDPYWGGYRGGYYGEHHHHHDWDDRWRD